MKAMIHAKPGGSQVPELAELPDPVASKGQLRIRVGAAALGQVDQVWLGKDGKGSDGPVMSKLAEDFKADN